MYFWFWLSLLFTNTRYDRELVKLNIKEVTAQKSSTLKQWLLSCRFLCWIITSHLGIPNKLCNFPVMDLVCLTCLWQSIANIILKEVAIVFLLLLRVVVVSRYWRSWWPFDEAFCRSQTLLQRSMTVGQPLFQALLLLFWMQ